MIFTLSTTFDDVTISQYFHTRTLGGCCYDTLLLLHHFLFWETGESLQHTVTEVSNTAANAMRSLNQVSLGAPSEAESQDVPLQEQQHELAVVDQDRHLPVNDQSSGQQLSHEAQTVCLESFFFFVLTFAFI